VTVRGHLVTFEVDGVIIGPMWGHELGFFPGKHIKEVMILWRDYFGNEFPLIRWEWFGMQRGSGCGVVPNCPKVG